MPVGVEVVTPASQYLMAVCLMSYIPYNAVVGRIEDIVECHRQFHCSHTGCKVARIFRKFLDDILPQLFAYLWQLSYLQFSQVFRVVYGVKQVVCR